VTIRIDPKKRKGIGGTQTFKDIKTKVEKGYGAVGEQLLESGGGEKSTRNYTGRRQGKKGRGAYPSEGFLKKFLKGEGGGGR